VEQLKSEAGLDFFRLSVTNSTNTEISTADVFCFGAHVARWFEKDKSPFLFLSEKAILDGTKAIRGGIPLCWPQFSNMGPLKQHGIARDSKWEFVSKDSGEDFASVTLQLKSTSSSKAIWDHEFIVFFTVKLLGTFNSSLETRFHVKNCGTSEFSFQLAKHTYFSVADISQTCLGDLAGTQFLDNLRDRSAFEQKESLIEFAGEVDRIYLETQQTLFVGDKGNARKFVVTKSSNMPDAVVWNPWIVRLSPNLILDNAL